MFFIFYASIFFFFYCIFLIFHTLLSPRRFSGRQVLSFSRCTTYYYTTDCRYRLIDIRNFFVASFRLLTLLIPVTIFMGFSTSDGHQGKLFLRGVPERYPSPKKEPQPPTGHNFCGRISSFLSKEFRPQERCKRLSNKINSILICESWKMTEKVKRKLNGAASKMLATITGRTIQEEARNPTINVVMKARYRRWSWLGHVLRMPEHRLVRQVLRQTYSRDAFRRRTKPRLKISVNVLI